MTNIDNLKELILHIRYLSMFGKTIPEIACELHEAGYVVEIRKEDETDKMEGAKMIEKVNDSIIPMTSREAYIAFKMGVPVKCRVQGMIMDSEYTIVAYTEYIPKRRSLKDKIDPNKYAYSFTIEDKNGCRITTTASELIALRNLDETFIYFDIPIPEGV